MVHPQTRTLPGTAANQASPPALPTTMVVTQPITARRSSMGGMDAPTFLPRVAAPLPHLPAPLPAPLPRPLPTPLPAPGLAPMPSPRLGMSRGMVAMHQLRATSAGINQAMVHQAMVPQFAPTTQMLAPSDLDMWHCLFRNLDYLLWSFPVLPLVRCHYGELFHAVSA